MKLDNKHQVLSLIFKGGGLFSNQSDNKFLESWNRKEMNHKTNASTLFQS